MLGQQLVLYEEEYNKISVICNQLTQAANARVVFLVDKNGQLIANAGDVANLDTTSLASLTAGSIAATGGLAKLIGEDEFSVLFHEGARVNLHITLVADRVILVVIFDKRTSLGLVRLRVKKAGEELDRIFESISQRSGAASSEGSPFSEITDEDIDNLFND